MDPTPSEITLLERKGCDTLKFQKRDLTPSKISFLNKRDLTQV